MRFQDDNFGYKDYSFDDLRILRICQKLEKRELHKKDSEFVESIMDRLEKHLHITIRQKQYLVDLLSVEMRIDRAAERLEDEDRVETRAQSLEREKAMRKQAAREFYQTDHTDMPEGVKERLRKIGIKC